MHISSFKHIKKLLIRHKHLPDNELCSLHCAVAPDFRVVFIVADDHADFHPLWAFTDNCAEITGSPPFNRGPREQLAVLLNDLALRVDEHQRIVRVLLGMLLVLFSRDTKDAPNSSLLACFAKEISDRSRHRLGSVEHLLAVVLERMEQQTNKRNEHK